MSKNKKTDIVGRIDELAEKGEISGQVAHYLKRGKWPKIFEEVE